MKVVILKRVITYVQLTVDGDSVDDVRERVEADDDYDWTDSEFIKECEELILVEQETH